MVSRGQTYGAIRKLLGSLDDPFTRFLEPSRLAALRRGTAGQQAALVSGGRRPGCACYRPGRLLTQQQCTHTVCFAWNDSSLVGQHSQHAKLRASHLLRRVSCCLCQAL